MNNNYDNVSKGSVKKQNAGEFELHEFGSIAQITTMTMRQMAE